MSALILGMPFEAARTAPCQGNRTLRKILPESCPSALPRSEAIVEDIGNSGDGIVRREGRVMFVPYGVTGDEIDFVARPSPRLAEAALRKSGPARVPPPCPHHGDMGRPGCGGCRMQQLASEPYRAWKRGLVLEALSRAGVEAVEIAPLQVSPPYSRRRAALAAERRGRHTVTGFMQRGTHRIVDMHTCLILRPELFALVAPLRALPLLNDRERADYLLTISENSIDLVIERKRDLRLPEREALAEFAQKHDIARISWRASPRAAAEPVVHARPVYARFGSVMVPLPPGGFLQATAEGEAALVAAVMSALPQAGRMLDLFAGSGTFTFPAAGHGRGRIHAVEGNTGAVEAIRLARHSGVTAEHRDLFRSPVTDFRTYDAAILDPPYAGAKAQAEALAASGLPLIIAVSCNPASFARDAAILTGGGYRLERVVPVDQFLWSAEVEMAGVFRR